VSQVFVHSPGLMERKGSFNLHTEMIPNGVDSVAYSRQCPEPDDLAHIPRPRIGYTGWHKKHLDWALILSLTERHKDWSFVFVGPSSPHAEVREPIEQLTKRKNVYMLGAKSTEVLASYPQHFDVCIMPYALNEYTKYIYPLKLHEYLAAGRPTVATRIRSLEEFSNLLALPTTVDDWSLAIADALRPERSSPEQVRIRQKVGSQHDWEVIVARIARTIAQRLGPSFVKQMDSAIDQTLPTRLA
jgi:glycosyltransferase involved in cell wall biosynthesis